MATATKNARTIQSSTSNAGAATTTGTVLDLTTALGALVAMRITNGATAPTTPCDAIVLVSTDNTDFYEFARYQGPDGNSEESEFHVAVPPEVLYVNVEFEGNDDQAVTVEAEAHELTSIS